MLSIGKPIWGVEVRVVDEQDKALPPGPENMGPTGKILKRELRAE